MFTIFSPLPPCLLKPLWPKGDKIVYEEAPPRGATPYPVMYHFDRKVYISLLIWNAAPLLLVSTVNVPSFKYE